MMKTKITPVACLFLLVTILAGCSKSVLPPATTRASLTTSVDNYNYLIGPGDSLNIFVWRNPEVSGTFLVRPDGKITTRLVEDLEVSGRTTTQLAREVEQVLSKYIRDPIVTVSVSRFNGPFSEQVRVIGEAANPRAINYQEDMTLLDLMIQAGGMTNYANGDGAKLIRVVDGKQVEYAVYLDSLIKDGEIEYNVDILPGDILIIPEAWF